MSDLATRRCRPAGGLPRLDRAAAQDLLRALGGWALDDGGTSIARVFEFRDFHETIAFVNAVAWIAHREDHHPDLEVGYRRCAVRYATHAASGLTENDFICAAKVDALLPGPDARG